MCGQQNRKMNICDTFQELTQTCIDLRKKIDTTNSFKEKTDLVLNHIKHSISNSQRVYDFQQGLEWFNVSEELSLQKHLHGKIIILDFFTYCCINCMHILPDLADVEQKFSPEDGLVVVGVHSAKFDNERNSDKILSAIQRYRIAHPVVNDAKLSMWRDIGISCWPSLVILGPNAELLFAMVGEGHRNELFLYAQVCLEYFKSVNLISSHPIPLKLAQHLLSTTNKILQFPGKIQTFSSGNEEKLILSDTGNNRILILNTNGEIENIIGGHTFGFEDGNFEVAKFNSPQGTCYHDNCIYVADTENHAVRKIDLKKKIVTTVAGIGSQGHDYCGGKLGTFQALSSPWDVTMYMHEQTDKNVAVLLIAIAGTHQIWALFLEDTKWWKNKYYKSGTCVSIVGSGREENRNNFYPHTASLAQPSGLALAQDLNILFFADSESSSIRKVDMTNGRVTAVCGADKNPSNLHDYGDIDGIQYNAKLQHPLGIAWDIRKKLLYIADTYNHKIKCVDLNYNCKSLCGSGQPKEAFKFDEPSGLAVGKINNNLYVADTNNHALKNIDLKNMIITEMSIITSICENEKNDKQFFFDTSINSGGGTMSISFELIFQDNYMKMNEEAPQKWKVHSLSKGLTINKLEGDITSPINIYLTKGEISIPLNISLEIITCKKDECKAFKLLTTFNVHRTHDAPENVTIKERLQIE